MGDSLYAIIEFKTDFKINDVKFKVMFIFEKESENDWKVTLGVFRGVANILFFNLVHDYTGVFP